VRTHKPDVAIVDIKMPPTHTNEGLKAALVIRAELPRTAVLVLSQYVEKEYAAELLADNAEGVGYLLKGGIYLTQVGWRKCRRQGRTTRVHTRSCWSGSRARMPAWTTSSGCAGRTGSVARGAPAGPAGG
jgi:hypothetical protein